MTGTALGTNWTTLVVAPPAGIEATIRATLDAQVMALSQWEPRSALSRFNRAPVGEWRKVDPDLGAVIRAGLAIGGTSDGALDIAMGALADLWGFGPPGPRSTVPDDDAIAAALACSGAAAIECDGDDHVRRMRDVALDFSGIGKGYIVDRLAAALVEDGARDFLVEIGGEFVGRGIRPDAQPWWVELENPPGIDLAPVRIAAHGIALATSGDYRRFVRHGGKRLGHTIDPRSGRPIANGVVSVSVIAADCMTADGWATALTVLGPVRGIDIATRENIAARIVTADGAETLSPALQAML